jgi:hypothetical protein
MLPLTSKAMNLKKDMAAKIHHSNMGMSIGV